MRLLIGWIYIMSMSNNFFNFLFYIQNYFDSHICTQIFIVMWEVRLFKSYLIRLHFPPWKCYSTHNMLYTLFASCQLQYFSLSQNQHQLTGISQPAVLFSHSKSTPVISHSQQNRVSINCRPILSTSHRAEPVPSPPQYHEPESKNVLRKQNHFILSFR